MGALKKLICILLLFYASISHAKHIEQYKPVFTYRTVIEFMMWEYFTISESCHAKCKIFFL